LDKHFFIVQWLVGRYHARPISAELARSIALFSLSVGHVHCPISGDWHFYFVNGRQTPVQADHIARELFNSETCCPQHKVRQHHNHN